MHLPSPSHVGDEPRERIATIVSPDGAHPAVAREAPIALGPHADREMHAAYILEVLRWMNDRGFRRVGSDTAAARWAVRWRIFWALASGRGNDAILFDNLMLNTRVGRAAIVKAFITGRMP